MAEVIKLGVSAVVDELLAPACCDKSQINEGTDAGSQVIELVNNLFIKAVQEEASDIHIEPFQDRTQIRFRVDGILHQKFQLPKESSIPCFPLESDGQFGYYRAQVASGWTYWTKDVKYGFGSADINCANNFREKGCYPDF